MPDKKPIEISTGIVLRTIVIILLLGFLYLVRDVIALFFISLIIVSAMEPTVDWMQRKKIPRTLGVILVYLGLLSVLGLSVYFLIPPLQEQFRDFSENLPAYSQKLEESFQGIKDYFETQHIVFDIQKIFNNLAEGLSQSSGGIFSKTLGIFSGFIAAIAVMTMAFYMAVKEDGIRKFVVSLVPEGRRDYAVHLVTKIKERIGKWMQGQLLLMFIIFVLDFIGLYFLGVPYALALAIFAGLMEIIPYVGPIISAVPGIIIGLTVSPLTGLLVFLMYVFVQQFENHIITPQVMKKAVGLNPVAVILALLIGVKLGGALGAILAVPVVAIVGVLADDLMGKNREKTEELQKQENQRQD